MIAEIGVFFLVLALLSSLVQTAYFLPLKPVKIITSHIMPQAAFLTALCITMAFVILIILRLNSDFSVLNVAEHSNLALPTLYKIAGTWGNHEGSMLLWVLVLALFGALLADSSSELKLCATALQSALCFGFLYFILATSNPFTRVFPPPTDGKELNPLLQDIGLAMHPPLLYLGYVGFSIVFSLAVAALLLSKKNKKEEEIGEQIKADWANTAHKWILVSWSALTLGIALGSWWAYRELGWGGWWFWDPVENASLLPWLAGTALLHSNIVLKKRGILVQWVILLAIITFALSLLGTFLVRSGVITSVHSFASDPERGVFILSYILVTVGGALLLYALRGGNLKSDKTMVPTSREGLIVVNNLFILSACATVLLGTLYPIFMELGSGEKITVGAAFFNATFLPLMAIPLAFAALTPFVSWKKANLSYAFRIMRPVIMAVMAVIFLTLALVKTKIIYAILGIGLAAWLFFGSIYWLILAKGKRGKYPVFLGHIGAAIAVFGIVFSGLWKEEAQKPMGTGDFITIADYKVTYIGSKDFSNENYSAKTTWLRVEDQNGKFIINLFPEYRNYNISKSGTSEVDIYYSLTGDLYSVTGEPTENGKVAVRLYFQPMINLLWLGFVLMTLGGAAGIFTGNSVERNKKTQRNYTTENINALL